MDRASHFLTQAAASGSPGDSVWSELSSQVRYSSRLAAKVQWMKNVALLEPVRRFMDADDSPVSGLFRRWALTCLLFYQGGMNRAQWVSPVGLKGVHG